MATRSGDKLRVAADARCLNVKHVRGMGRYFREVVTRLSEWGEVDWELFSWWPDMPFVIKESASARREIFALRGSRIRSWEQFALPWRMSLKDVDVMHCPATTMPWWQPVPTVVTVHDTLPWTGDEDRGIFTDRVLPRAYHKCAAIITISQCSFNDIVALWPALRKKTHVIPHGVEDCYLDAQPQALTPALVKLGIRGPYLLYLGGEVQRKRAEWAVKVLEGLEEPRPMLVMCGLNSRAQERVRNGMPEALRGRLVFAPFIEDPDMVVLYQNAIALLYPTLYEGFGFPALEAQAVGTPALFSALGSLAELQGPGAEVMPAEDLGAWVSTCRRLVQERREARPNADSRRWARGFSWDVSVRRHLEVYRIAAASRRAAPAMAESGQATA